MAKSKLLGMAMAMALMMGKMIDPLAKRMRSYSIRNKSNRSCYSPHQGKQECARRVRQMASGMLKP
jgi:hypothetical protein